MDAGRKAMGIKFGGQIKRIKRAVAGYMNYHAGPWDQEAYTAFGVSNLSLMDSAGCRYSFRVGHWDVVAGSVLEM